MSGPVYRQGCLGHEMRNIVAKLSRLMQLKMKELVPQVFRAPTYAAALRRGRDLIAKFKDRSRGDGVLGTRPGEVRHVPAIFRGPSPADSNDESTRAPQWRKPSANKGDPAHPNRPFVPVVAICQPDHGVETLARNSDGGGDAASARTTPNGGRARAEASRCVR